jgi:hypothetical protein
MGLSIYDETLPFTQYAQIIEGSGTGFVQCWTTAKGALRLDAIHVWSLSASAHYVRVAIENASGYLELGDVEIPAGAGHTTVPGVDLVLELAPAAIGAFVLAPTDILNVKCPVALGAGEAIGMSILGGYV